jgi:hypothetical protein
MEAVGTAAGAEAAGVGEDLASASELACCSEQRPFLTTAAIMDMGLVTVTDTARIMPLMVGHTLEAATSEGVGSRMAMVIACGDACAFATECSNKRTNLIE